MNCECESLSVSLDTDRGESMLQPVHCVTVEEDSGGWGVGWGGLGGTRVRLHYTSVAEGGRSPIVSDNTTTVHINTCDGERVTNLSVRRSHHS